MQRTADSRQDSKKEYDQLLAEAVKLSKQHETKAKYFIPRMYEALRKEGLLPFDAADRIYRDVMGIWQKDTIRRLLPPETKDQAARERQALSRLHMASDAGLILRKGSSSSTVTSAAAENHHYEDNDSVVKELEQENAKLKKVIGELENDKKLLLERTLRLEKWLAEEQQRRQQQQEEQEQEKQLQNHHSAQDRGTSKQEEEVTILLPPKLFMKTYALMRGSSKPLLLKVKAEEVVDIDITNLPR